MDPVRVKGDLVEIRDPKSGPTDVGIFCVFLFSLVFSNKKFYSELV